MKLDDVTKVTELGKERAQLLALREAARTGSLGDFNIWMQGERYRVIPLLSDEPIRSAVIVAAEERIVAIDADLSRLGVRVERPMRRDEGTVGDWKRAAEMYSRAWLRELGGKLLPKAHFIDALVLTTQQMRERAERVEAAKAE